MKQKNRGILVVLSGFSGAGKGTVVKEIMKKYEDCYALSISATTRAPREGEQHGVEYFFKTREEFETMIAEDAFIEYAQYVTNSYGTPKAYVEQQLSEGKDVILEIEVQGALKVKEKFPETTLIFLTPPNAEELKRRLVNRGTETMEVIESRLARAAEEVVYMDDYDYLLINDKVEDCVEQFHKIVTSEKDRAFRKSEFIADMRSQLTAFAKKQE